MTATTQRDEKSEKPSQDTFDILNGPGNALLATYDVQAGDTPKHAEEVRAFLNTLDPGSYWIVSTRRNETSLRKVEVTDDDGNKTSTQRRIHRSSHLPSLSDEARAMVLKDRRAIVMSLKVPSAVIDHYFSHLR